MNGHLGSILLGSADPERLRAWYRTRFTPAENADGFLDLGGVGLLVCGRDDVSAANPEPGRVILNIHVDDAHATAARLNEAGVTWLVPVESRADGLFGTLTDPDGNYVQIIELNAEYHARQATPARRTWEAERETR